MSFSIPVLLQWGLGWALLGPHMLQTPAQTKPEELTMCVRGPVPLEWPVTYNL